VYITISLYIYSYLYAWWHSQILSLYKQYIDPDFTWSNFTVEEQAKVIVAPRSNNLLDTKRVSVCDPCTLMHSQYTAQYLQLSSRALSLHCLSPSFAHAHTHTHLCTLCGHHLQIEGEFPELLPIKESLIKYVFEPNAADRERVCSSVREMRGR
jgi:3,5-epimerase/4-reductase